MKDCCLQTLGMMNSKYCCLCGLPLTPDKAELPEGYYAHPMAKGFNVEKQILDIMNKIDKILEYLKQKERGL